MYDAFYNLQGEPFRPSPDPGFTYPHPSYARARSYLQQGLERGKGIVVITGATGVGKSTLVAEVMKNCQAGSVVPAKLVLTRIKPDELMHMLAAAFGLSIQQKDPQHLRDRLIEYFQSLANEGRRALLLADEAQGAAPRMLEDLHRFTGERIDGWPLLQLFLLGQEALGDLVQSQAMQSLYRAIIGACHVYPLDEAETRRYVERRLQHVEWNGDPTISADAFQAIFRSTGGIPGPINLLCSRLLLYGSIDLKHRLDGADVATVTRELQEEGVLGATQVSRAKAMDARLATMDPGAIARTGTDNSTTVVQIRNAPPAGRAAAPGRSEPTPHAGPAPHSEPGSFSEATRPASAPSGHLAPPEDTVRPPDPAEGRLAKLLSERSGRHRAPQDPAQQVQPARGHASREPTITLDTERNDDQRSAPATPSLIAPRRAARSSPRRGVQTGHKTIGDRILYLLLIVLIIVAVLWFANPLITDALGVNLLNTAVSYWQERVMASL